MNKKAQELNLKHTHFITPHGLDEEGHYTTGYELALIADYALNIEKIAITDTYTVVSKVKEMFKELIRNKSFVFNKLFSIQKHNRQEVVTAFSGLLELSRRSKVETEQDGLFGDINVKRKK